MTRPEPHAISEPGGARGPIGGSERGAEVQKLKRDAQTWTIASLASAVLACSCGFGLVGGLLCYMATLSLSQGNIADGRAKLKLGKVVTVVGAVMGLVAAFGWLLARIVDLF